MSKIDSRKRRAAKTKARIKLSDRPRLVVYRSSVHIYASIVQPDLNGDKTLVTCSTIDKELHTQLSGTKIEQAQLVGKTLAERAKQKSIDKVAFDRAGYKYHGRVAALAESARNAGLNF